METQSTEQRRGPRNARVLWIALLLAILAISAGGYYWYEQMAVKYDRITNAKRV